MDVLFPSQLKRKDSMHRSFEDFTNARASVDVVEIPQDVPLDLHSQTCTPHTVHTSLGIRLKPLQELLRTA